MQGHGLTFHMQHVSTCVSVLYVCLGVWSVCVERVYDELTEKCLHRLCDGAHGTRTV